VHVDDVEFTGPDLLARPHVTAPRRRRQIGDGAVGTEADGAPERRQVVGQLKWFRRRPMGGTADQAGGIGRGEDANVVPSAEELLGERFDVPVDAPLE
jgi:hypothetical protein